LPERHHVVADALDFPKEEDGLTIIYPDDPPSRPLRIELPQVCPGTYFKATTVHWDKPDENQMMGDIAWLKVDAVKEDMKTVFEKAAFLLQLNEHEIIKPNPKEGDFEYTAKGFISDQENKKKRAWPVSGFIVDRSSAERCRYRNADLSERPFVMKTFSGTPVWFSKSGLLGIISDIEKHEADSSAYMIPNDILEESFDKLLAKYRNKKTIDRIKASEGRRPSFVGTGVHSARTLSPKTLYLFCKLENGLEVEPRLSLSSPIENFGWTTNNIKRKTIKDAKKLMCQMQSNNEVFLCNPNTLLKFAHAIDRGKVFNKKLTSLSSLSSQLIQPENKYIRYLLALKCYASYLSIRRVASAVEGFHRVVNKITRLLTGDNPDIIKNLLMYDRWDKIVIYWDQDSMPPPPALIPWEVLTVTVRSKKDILSDYHRVARGDIGCFPNSSGNVSSVLLGEVIPVVRIRNCFRSLSKPDSTKIHSGFVLTSGDGKYSDNEHKFLRRLFFIKHSMRAETNAPEGQEWDSNELQHHLGCMSEHELYHFSIHKTNRYFAEDNMTAIIHPSECEKLITVDHMSLLYTTKENCILFFNGSETTGHGWQKGAKCWITADDSWRHSIIGWPWQVKARTAFLTAKALYKNMHNEDMKDISKALFFALNQVKEDCSMNPSVLTCMIHYAPKHEVDLDKVRA